MDFLDIANRRQSCSSYDAGRDVEQEKLEAVLAAARLSPSPTVNSTGVPVAAAP